MARTIYRNRKIIFSIFLCYNKNGDNMKKILFIITLLFIPFVINAYEIKDKVFDTNYSDVQGVAATSDGGYIAVGNKNKSIIIKYDKNDQIEWEKTLEDFESQLFDVEVTTDGYVAVGDLGLIIKFDKLGNVLWNKTYQESVLMNDVEILKDGTYIVVGSTTKNQISNAFILNYSKNGELLYEKKPNKSSGYIIYNGVEATNDGGYIVGGATSITDLESIYEDDLNNQPNADTPIYGLVSEDPESTAIIIKYNNKGKIEWIQNILNGSKNPYYKDSTDPIYGVVNTTIRDGVYDFIQSSDGEYVVVGRVSMNSVIKNLENTYGSNMLYTQPFIAKYKEDGTLRWISFDENILSGSFNDVIEAEDGSFWVVGNTCPDQSASIELILANYSSTGEELLYKQYKGENSDEYKFSNIDMLSEKNIVAVGSIKFPLSFETFSNGTVEFKTYMYSSIVYVFRKNYELTPKPEISEKVNVTNIGNDFTIEINPSKGYMIDKVSVYGADDNTQMTELIKESNNKYNIKNLKIDSILDVSFKEAQIIKDETTENSNFHEVSRLEDGRGMITVNPNEGYKISQISIKDSSGNEVEYTQENNIYYVDLYDSVVVSITYENTIDNPKTGILDLMTILIIGFIISITGFFLVKNYNERFEI